jgi:hypothetical protein
METEVGREEKTRRGGQEREGGVSVGANFQARVKRLTAYSDESESLLSGTVEQQKKSEKRKKNSTFRFLLFNMKLIVKSTFVLLYFSEISKVKL